MKPKSEARAAIYGLVEHMFNHLYDSTSSGHSVRLLKKYALEVASGKVDGKNVVLMIRKNHKVVPEFDLNDGNLKQECKLVAAKYGVDNMEHKVADGNYRIALCEVLTGKSMQYLPILVALTGVVFQEDDSSCSYFTDTGTTRTYRQVIDNEEEMSSEDLEIVYRLQATVLALEAIGSVPVANDPVLDAITGRDADYAWENEPRPEFRAGYEEFRRRL
ncbi:hypothetical protein BKA67DRAFT_665522 [Truncatella angustata]|uniref:Uncharacterized protein n=1 Tax=Truncatella angustata TaxID=152316 RepID=A0A9P8UAJ8_9PEZI|nr:uncharacterized protein BKA67DRAFT_665522 [Truncatella angustata]KAH6638573.1 hypothetical protein BKA67DRAFT_665522 [Truncatella angustata]KAH8194258.1 hypothetical protein TruAng_011579 [Truncatella angustata]